MHVYLKRSVVTAVALAIVALAVWIARSHRSSSTPVVNLRSFGAVGNGVADDGPALQRALDALANAGGGTLHVPAGRYAIATPVARTFAARALAIAIKGQGPGRPIDVSGNGSGLRLTSEFIIKTGRARTALSLGGLESLLIADMVFSGTTDVRDDAHAVLHLHEIGRARIEHCEFYGLASMEPGGSIITASRSALEVDRTAFLGCATNSAHSSPVIQNLSWQDIVITNTKFIDYGNRRDLYSKTGLGTAYSWIGIGDAGEKQASSSRRDAVIRNVFLDEGAFIGITVRPDLHGTSSAPFNVFISRIRMNVSNLAASGLYVVGAEKVLIEKSRFGWSHNADAAIVLRNVSEAILDGVECVAGASTIRADRDTERVVIINSTYGILDSAAPYTKKLTTPDDPVRFVRTQYLEVLRAEPKPHLLYDWADQMLRCESDASCLAGRRDALKKHLETAHKTAATRRRD